MGGAQPEKPTSYSLDSTAGDEIAILIGGDLRTINAVRDFWQLVIQTLESSPKSIKEVVIMTNTEPNFPAAACPKGRPQGSPLHLDPSWPGVEPG